MATAKLEKVKDDFLTCVVCHEIFTDPCTLNCQHSFCCKCITDYTQTKRTAILAKVISCPSCRQDSSVPDPTKKVEKWAEQFKPGIVVLGLMETIECNANTHGEEELCSLCHRIGETCKAVMWCPQCEESLCERCEKIHRTQPILSKHVLSNLSDKGKMLRRRKVMCEEHLDEEVRLHCRDCSVPVCPLCAAIYHRKCDEVVTIAIMMPKMKFELSQIRNHLCKKESLERNEAQSKKKAAEAIKKTRDDLLSEIITIHQKIRKKSREKQKELTDEIEEITAKEIERLNADEKTRVIEVQTFGQYSEYINQILNSGSDQDVYDTYYSYLSGDLIVETEGEQCVVESIKSIKLHKSPNFDLIQLVMNQYKIVVTYEKKTNPKPTVLYRSTDFPNESTRQVGQRDFQDVLILYNEEEETVIVTDSNNNCINSFIDTPQGPLHNTLLLDSWPWGVTRLKDNIVLVAVPGSHQIVTVEASRELTLVSTVQTDKEYYSLAVIGTDWIAAGSDYSVDIINMNGEFIRCLTPPGSVSYPWYMCVGTWGQLVVSDSLKKTVTCWTVSGELEWTYSSTEEGELTDPRGVKTTREGDFIVADNQLRKVIVLSMSGQYVRDVLTSEDGLMSPTGIFDNGNGSLYVCDDTLVKEFLTIDA